MAPSALRYGTHRGQVADLRRPAGATGDLPVVVLIHGGYWKAAYTKVLMRRLAAAVAASGWIAYNIEYRRVGPLGGGGGWPATFEDVAAAIDHLRSVDGVDLDRVVTCGHSAGGLLGLWAGGRHRLPSGVPGHDPKVAVRGAVSLAGVVDLEAAAALGLGGGAVPRLLGGLPAERPERYRVTSPPALLPLGIPQVLVHGTADDTVPPALSEDYGRAARAAGDDAVVIPVAGAGHLQMIDPGGQAWAAAAAHLPRLLGLD